MTTIRKGHDLLETVSAYFTFPNDMRIPAGFFDPHSAPFMGMIEFRGVPIKEFQTHKTGSTDTVVERLEDAVIPGTSGSATIRIELVKLPLVSVHPIKVTVGRREQLWNVHASVASSPKSTGTMTITQTSATGGNFSSKISVVPLFKFVRRSDEEEKTLDIGAMPIPREKREQFIARITLESSEVAWGTAPADPDTALHIAALAGNFLVAETNAEAALLASHHNKGTLLQ
jgi:hypothetical protein